MVDLNERAYELKKAFDLASGADISNVVDIAASSSRIAESLERSIDHLANKFPRSGSLAEKDAGSVHNLLITIAEFSPKLKRNLDAANLNKSLDYSDYNARERLRNLFITTMRERDSRNKIINELRDSLVKLHNSDKAKEQFKNTAVYKQATDLNQEMGQAVIGRGSQANYDDVSYIGKQSAYLLKTFLTSIFGIVAPGLLPENDGSKPGEDPFMKMAGDRRPINNKGSATNVAPLAGPAAPSAAPLPGRAP